MSVLVTGGAGYIGSHMVQVLREAGREVAVVDSLLTGHRDAVPPSVPMLVADVADRARVTDFLREHRVDSVLHFASRSQVEVVALRVEAPAHPPTLDLELLALVHDHDPPRRIQGPRRGAGGAAHRVAPRWESATRRSWPAARARALARRLRSPAARPSAARRHSMRHRPSLWAPRTFALVALAFAPYACDDATPPAAPRDATVDADAATGPDVAAADGGDAQAPAPLTDGEVVAVLESIDSGEIGLGLLAMAQAGDARVRDFGAAMVSRHTASSARITALRRRVGITATESDLSRMLGADAAGTRGRLAALSGAAFDRAYVDAQVMVHAHALALLDRALVPATVHVELRTALMDEVRPMVAAHLQQARDLQAAVGAP